MARDDFYESAFGRAYSAYMERPRLSRLIGRALWGGDSAPYYESMSAISEADPEATIVDCPCGAGPALRMLDPHRPAATSARWEAIPRPATGSPAPASS
jgi:hypothetical protein